MQPAVSDDLDALEDHINRQEAIVKELDAQRTAVISLLQRGKDLQHHAAAPAFLAGKVHQLEAQWGHTNDTASDKLKKLKGELLDS